MKKIAIITAALLITSTSAFAAHNQVGDAARNTGTQDPAVNGPSSDDNKSSNARRGYEALSNNPGKAEENADKTDE